MKDCAQLQKEDEQNQKIVRRRIAELILWLFIISLAITCSPIRYQKVNSVRLSGSTTMLPLAKLWAENYMKLHPDIAIYIDAGGTARGVEALINNKADICMASRPLQATEAKSLAKRYRSLGMRFLVARDAICVYIHPDNPITNLTLDQVVKIFTGEITNWSQLGGLHKPIMLFVRAPNSGTYLYFRHHVLDGKPYAKFSQFIPTASQMIEAVAKHRQAIGYGGLAHEGQIIHCRINGIEPTISSVRDDTYPIIRYLYLYTKNTPRGEAKRFIDWVLSEGQRIVSEAGFISLWESHRN